MTTFPASIPPSPSRDPARHFPIREIALVAALAIVGIISTAPSWLALFATPPMTYPELPYPVPSSIVYDGEPLVLSVMRCSTASAPMAITSTRYLERESDGARVPLTPGSATVEPGCRRDRVPLDVIDPDLRAGRYRISGVATVYGPYRTHNVPWVSEYFEVRHGARPATEPAT